MEKYTGTKTIKATPLKLGEYNRYRKWDMPEDEDPETLGYMVGYSDAKGNFDGDEIAGCHHISWSPKDVFESSYVKHCNDAPPNVKPFDIFTFGLAIEAMKKGLKVARKGWNGKDMFCYYVPGGNFAALTKIARNMGDTVKYRPYIALKTAQNDIAAWSPSGSDALAEDWVIID